MPAKLDLVGKRFGKLTVVAETSKRRHGGVIWSTCCDCGSKNIEVAGSYLKGSPLPSCGCELSTLLGKGGTKNTIHGQSHGKGKKGSHLYMVWVAMRRRCNNPRQQRYDRYGGRGIKICRRWDDFATFVADMGEPPTPQHQLDRIDNDGDYCPENCRWATRSENVRNSSKARYITYNGESLCLTDWAERLGVSRSAIINRVKNGWSEEEAVSIPSGQRRKSKAVG